MNKEKWQEKIKNAFSKKSLAVFFNKFGFYLILLVCLGIIGVTAALTRGERDEIAKGQEDPSHGIDISITDVIESEMGGIPRAPSQGKPGSTKAEVIKPDDTKANDVSSNELKPDDTKADDETTIIDEQPVEKTEDEPNIEPEEKSSEMPAMVLEEEVIVPVSSQTETSSEAMILPIDGEVTQPFIMDTLVYSQTLKEWTTHAGIDIAGDIGDEVRAALPGTVESIEEDSLRGIVITLIHDQDLKTVYTGLSTKDMVRVGQRVEKGQVISGIGRTAAFEITDDPHLHFEVLFQGESVDPMDYIKEK